MYDNLLLLMRAGQTVLFNSTKHACLFTPDSCCHEGDITKVGQESARRSCPHISCKELSLQMPLLHIILPFFHTVMVQLCAMSSNIDNLLSADATNKPS